MFVGKECSCIFSGLTSLSILVRLVPPFHDQHCHSVSERIRVLKPIIPPFSPVLDLFIAGSLKMVAFPNISWQENIPNVPMNAWWLNPNLFNAGLKWLIQLSSHVACRAFLRVSPSDAIEVLHDVGRIRHARPQHHLSWNLPWNPSALRKNPRSRCLNLFDSFWAPKR
jgi:hypothetical protein